MCLFESGCHNPVCNRILVPKATQPAPSRTGFSSRKPTRKIISLDEGSRLRAVGKATCQKGSSSTPWVSITRDLHLANRDLTQAH
jgi:hypothetical protein